MTHQEKQRLRDRLYEAHLIAGADYYLKEEDPFVRIYFVNLVKLLDDYKNGKL